MDMTAKIFAHAGLIKMPLHPLYHSDDKMRLYFFSDQTPEAIAKIQTTFDLEIKGKSYQGLIHTMFQDIQTKPYLLKTGRSFKLVGEEEAMRLSIGKAGNNLGDVYTNLREYSKAIECYKKDLQTAQQLKDKAKEGQAYSNLGRTYDFLGENGQAIAYYELFLQIALDLKNAIGIGSAYRDLGIAHHKSREIHKASCYYKKHLKIALELKNKVEEGKAYNNLGIVYYELGDIHQSIEYYKKDLQIACDLEHKIGQIRAYCNLGNAYVHLGDIRQAIIYQEKCLEIAIDIKDKIGEGRAYCNLGISYSRLGEFHQAIDYYEKHLKMTQELCNKVEEGKAHVNLGEAYYTLGEIRKAIDYFNKGLKIAQILQNKEEEANSYGSLGNAYCHLGKYHTAIHYHRKCLEIVREDPNKGKEGDAYCNLGIVYRELGEPHKAIDYHNKHLEITQKCQDRLGEGKAYCNLGNAYYELGELHKAINYHKKHLEIALDLKNKIEEGRAYGNLGNAYKDLGKYSQAEEYFRKSIKINAFLQHDAKRAEWQITLFEEFSKSYISLEKVLLLQNEDCKALEISDIRRSRALSSLLLQKLTLKEAENLSINSLSFKEIQELAKKFHTTFVMYSLISWDNTAIQVWLISSEERSLKSILLPILNDTFPLLDQIFKTFPYQTEGQRPARGRKNPSQEFDKKLSSWYDFLIAPLEQHLPSPESGETITFIPDGFLAHLPFGAFHNRASGKYLIESYPIAVAPSIQVLSLLDQLPKEFAHQALLMGNPTTLQKEDNTLKESEREVRDVVSPLMQNLDVKVFTEGEAQVEKVFKHAPSAKWIHIACHGIAEQKPLDDPHSVFEGFFKLAPGEQYPLGQLHAKDVNELALTADLVFMSACHLGRGNLKQEGSIGPIWSFLGSGAKSTIASYWPLPEGDMTVKMVDTFYRHYLGVETPKLNKAKALQQAVLMAMKTERNKPRQWGAFFLSGLIE
ncbi:MAG: CHAT domain-containing protein [Candidatus Rhabdochlamydia sp.]